MPREWISLLSWHVALLLLGAVLGWLYGNVALGILLAVLAALSWHLVNLWRLDRWLRTGQIGELPGGRTVWPQIFARIAEIREKSRRRRRRWRNLVRDLRASASAVPDGGIILNDKHEILAFNLMAQQLLGLKKGRDRGQRIENLIRHPDFVNYLRQGDFSRSVEIPAPLNGDVWLSCLMIPYGREQSLLLIRDISEGVRLERTRRDFVANASHELRTPLTVISGYLDALSDDGALPPAWHQALAEMRAQATRMRNLLDELLELARLQSAAHGSRQKVVDVAAIVAAVCKNIQALPECQQKFNVSINSPARLLGEESEIESVVSNLVSNAVRYTPPGGTITIRWDVDENGGHLSVADTGIGIAEEDISRITERFYRTDQGRARHKAGTGLGLAIVKHALRRHEAELEIQSRLGAGSTFTCHFPAHRLELSPSALSMAS